MIGTGVPVLFRLRRPAAIAWLVWAVVILSLDGVSRGWLLAHVREEIYKRLPPPITDGNATPAIAGVAGVTWVAASLNHVAPGQVFATRAFPLGVAVCHVGCGRKPPMLAAAVR